jgi:hypothetical protein
MLSPSPEPTLPPRAMPAARWRGRLVVQAGLRGILEPI